MAEIEEAFRFIPYMIGQPTELGPAKKGSSVFRFRRLLGASSCILAIRLRFEVMGRILLLARELSPVPARLAALSR